jgi:molybdate transport system permease protein
MRSRPVHLVLGLSGAVLVALLTLPIVALALGGPTIDLLAGLRHPAVGPALYLSLVTSSLALVLLVALGTPLAWWLAHARAKWVSAVEVLVALPIVVPPAVAGVALLLAFGRRGLIGATLDGWGVAIGFTPAAVVLAQLFVAAPFYLQAAVSAFRRIDPSLLLVAKSLGAEDPRVLLEIGVPLARSGLVAGAAIAWARALGEFGATLLFAGNLEGRTQTLPLAIYTTLEHDLGAARSIALLLVAVAFALLFVVRATSGVAEARERR